MSTLSTILITLIPPVAIFSAVYAAIRTINKGRTPKKAFKNHLVTLAVVFVMFSLFAFGVSAEEVKAVDTELQTSQAASQVNGLGLIAAGICTGLAGIGGGIALAAGAPAAIGATAEDPKNFSKALIFVALGETIALYGVVISVMILSKI